MSPKFFDKKTIIWNLQKPYWKGTFCKYVQLLISMIRPRPSNTLVHEEETLLLCIIFVKQTFVDKWVQEITENLNVKEIKFFFLIWNLSLTQGAGKLELPFVHFKNWKRLDTNSQTDYQMKSITRPLLV